MDRHQEALAEGRAVTSEILNDVWRRHLGHAVPEVTESQAGRALGRIAQEADLTLFAHYATDTAGHRGGMEGGVAALERVDRFLSGVLETLPSDTTLLLASDHGNLEDASAEHTRNPALGVASGPGAGALARSLRSILDVAPATRVLLGLDR
jgi:bisphosphoglycerate-independent phosphoglycerate mutase (AlkP superfamily)